MAEEFDNVGGGAVGVINLDFTGVADGFEALPVGLYLIAVQKIEMAKSKAGNAMLNVTLTVLEPTEFAGRYLWDRLSLLPQSRWVVKRFLKGIGVADEDLAGELEVDLDEIVGAESVVEVQHRVYEGRTSSEIARYLPADTPLSVEGDDLAITQSDVEDLPF